MITTQVKVNGGMFINEEGLTGNISFIGGPGDDAVRVGYFDELWVENIYAGELVEKSCGSA